MNCLLNMLSALHEHKGKQELYVEGQPDVLTALLEVAKIQSTKASNRKREFINIAYLPKGVYFAQIGDRITKILKE